MRLRVASVVVLVFGASACAAITGLGEYGEKQNEAALEAPDSSADESSTTDGTVTTGDDASQDSNASDDAMSIPDVAFDGPPVCGPGSSCKGCCMNGTCVGGQSVTTCGVGGELCVDCTSKGGACSSAGACTTPPKDAEAAAPCNATKCIACAPVYQTGCCKADNTCGCKVQIPPSNTCN
jgi:hypothetical protein